MLLVEQRNASSINSDRLLFQPWLCDVDSIHFLHCATVHYKLMESGTPEIDSRVSFISLKSSLIQYQTDTIRELLEKTECPWISSNDDL